MGNNCTTLTDAYNTLDKTGYEELNDDQLHAIRSHFMKSYPNGYLTLAEFLRVNKQLYPESSTEFWENLFHALDHDDNGFLDLREYLIAYSIVTNANVKEDRLQFWFQLLDKDGNGVISFEECEYLFATLLNMSEILRESSEDETDSDSSSCLEKDISLHIQVLFEKMDEDKDGTVTFEEFKRAVETDTTLQKLLYIEMSVEKQAILHQNIYVQPEAFTMQVAGHGSDAKSKRNLKFLMNKKHKEGIKKIGNNIWKPLDDTEYNFYEYIFHPSRMDDPIIQELKTFVPEYHGRTYIEFEDQRIVYYIILEDVLAKFSDRPCIADLKIGSRGYDSRANWRKRVQQIGFCKLSTSRTLGFRFCGYKTFDLLAQEERCLSKFDGGLLNVSGVENHLRLFIDNGHKLRFDVYEKALVPLKKILNWFQNQKRFQFYSSSLLIAYDSNNDDSDVIVRMVDFAHTDIDPRDRQYDKSYIFGLTKLIQMLENIVSSNK